MRVIAGKYKRIKLNSPRNDRIRPTGDKIKETLFNMLEPQLYGACFVDLFAGSGQIGIEALSRGADPVIFIDIDKESINLINENIDKLKTDDETVVIRGQIPGCIDKAVQYNPNIIFMDPPYKKGLYQEIFEKLSENPKLPEEILIIAESDIKEEFLFLEDMGFYIEKVKNYKSNKHVFIRREGL